jgi:hypothetical protein
VLSVSVVLVVREVIGGVLGKGPLGRSPGSRYVHVDITTARRKSGEIPARSRHCMPGVGCVQRSGGPVSQTRWPSFELHSMGREFPQEVVPWLSP